MTFGKHATNGESYMAQGPESELSKRILSGFRGIGAWAYKVHGGPYARTGVPDILACVEGFFIALELKAPNRKPEPSANQRRELSSIQSAGGVAATVNSVDQAAWIIQNAMLHMRPDQKQELGRKFLEASKSVRRKRSGKKTTRVPLKGD